MLLDIRDAPADVGPGAPAAVAGIVRLARAARARWRVIFLLAGAVLTVVGVLLASGAVLIPGVLLLLFALLYGMEPAAAFPRTSCPGGPGTGEIECLGPEPRPCRLPHTGAVKLSPVGQRNGRRRTQDGVMHPKQDSGCQPSAPAVIVDADGLPALFEALRGRGYTVAGPTVRDGAN